MTDNQKGPDGARQQYEAARIRELHRHAAEVNARIIPDVPGTIRTSGPRRQFRAEVRGGRLHYTEI